MKRTNKLYNNMYKYKNIKLAFDEVCRNTANKKRVLIMRNNESNIITKVHDILLERKYKPGECNVFQIDDPKPRKIVSQKMIDKIINHLIAREILYPAVLPRLLDCNVASRKGLGTAKALKYRRDYDNYYDNYYKMRYGKYYILKADVSKFFQNIDHEILKEKLRKVIKDKDAIDILEVLIDSNIQESIGARSKYRRNDKPGACHFLFK